MITRRCLLEVGCRLFGLWLALELLTGIVMATIDMLVKGGASALILAVLQCLLILAWSLVFLFKAGRIAAWLLPEDDALDLREPELPRRLADLGVRLLGVWYFLWSLSAIIQGTAAFFQDVGPENAVQAAKWIMIVPLAIDLCLSFWLVRYAHVLVRWFYPGTRRLPLAGSSAPLSMSP